ncbi:hypothetical protein RFI_10266 [Reticulomyxa filosa]|uniref:Uncharacterized protein n=1 Tax=Reticulomyxa filosa TaxID=46433 RepID=X6NND8_RETFI|nr:hypothetical protein RFI_10266 [Reticulomyxa filosa]|eukprot:ETO26872.1 hypothetical protein RFI_10266 [Reticulomyxa filosa]
MYGRALYKCAIIYEKVGSHAQAEQCYQMCLKHFPQNRPIYVRYAMMLDHLDRSVDCNCIFQKGLQTIQDSKEKEKLTDEYVKWLKVLNEREHSDRKSDHRNNANNTNTSTNSVSSDSFLGVKAYGNDATLLSPLVSSKGSSVPTRKMSNIDLAHSHRFVLFNSASFVNVKMVLVFMLEEHPAPVGGSMTHPTPPINSDEQNKRWWFW